MTLLIVERQQRELQILRDRRSATFEALAEELGVSPSTVRRDIEALEEQGMVERTHGGAIFKGDQPADPPAPTSNAASASLASRLNEQVEAKQAIGRAAASLVQPGMTLLLDGGSTVVFAAREITARPLQIVTNSLTIANLFLDQEQVELVVLGGLLYPRLNVMFGPITTGCLADLHADLLFFSLAGIHGDAGFNINLSLANVEQMMLQQAAKSVMLMDATKFDRKSLVRVCSTSEVDHIITDAAIDQAWRDKLGEQLIVA